MSSNIKACTKIHIMVHIVYLHKIRKHHKVVENIQKQ
jgi:hypothetical protein